MVYWVSNDAESPLRYWIFHIRSWLLEHTEVKPAYTLQFCLK